MSVPSQYDLLVIGGGINGTGIARDAAGRGLSVLLVEKDDLASHTSSASTKLIHGGLRYLEFYEFRLVREALIERERLLAIAPHIIWPLEFVLPKPPGGRPGWMIRIGLMLYDRLGPRKRLAASKGVRLAGTAYGISLKPEIARGFIYSDCWVEDSRLVVLNALDAAERGARIAVRTRFVEAERGGDGWTATLAGEAGERTVRTRAIVNAAGPWVTEVLSDATGRRGNRTPRLVKGSHIVVPRLFAGEQAYMLQNEDGRIIFAIPYERDFTLIGTTDVAVDAPEQSPAITPEETEYLCAQASRYFAKPVVPGDVVHSYSGIRSLYDDGADEASEVTRDYVLELDAEGPALLSVFGGKITTYRRLAEAALAKLAPHLPAMGPEWTAGAALPGGEFGGGNFEAFLASVRTRWPWLPEATTLRMARAYGSRIDRLLGDALSLNDLGEDLGGGLSAREVDYLIDVEWARDAEDVLWRRSKIGLHAPDAGPKVAAHIAGRVA